MRAWRDGREVEISGFIWDEDRREWRCPTEKCGAWCCRNGSLFPDEPPPCPHLVGHQCGFQLRGGIGAKPYGCVMYPRSQADVDRMNEHAVGEERCYLTVREVE